MGLLFNNRRVSRDKLLIEDVIKETKDRTLYINEFSTDLFEDNIIIDDEFLIKAKEDEYCFVENVLLKSYEDKIQSLIVYKWNRDYPSDFKLDIDISMWKLIRQEEFSGNSHLVITKEEYIK